MKNENERIVRTCAFCIYASLTPARPEEDTPPLLFSLRADAFDEDTVTLTCPYKKQAAPDFSCRRFRFDPLKYRPKASPPLPTLDEDTLLLD